MGRLLQWELPSARSFRCAQHTQTDRDAVRSHCVSQVEKLLMFLHPVEPNKLLLCLHVEANSLGHLTK